MSDYKPDIIDNDRRILADYMISENEALTYAPYRDSVGKMSIGYGRNLDDKGISYQEAELMKANDIEECDRWLNGNFAFYYKLSEVRKAALIDMRYNLGRGGFLKFQKMIAALSIGDHQQAAAEMRNSKWWQQVGPRAKRNWYMMNFNKFVSKAEAQKYFEDNEQ